MWNIFGSSKKEPAKTFFKTDIHCHIIPGVDDGSPDVDTSLQLVERMRSFGIERIIASPHVTCATFENTPDVLDPALETLNDALKAATPAGEQPFVVERSAEYRLDDFFEEQFAKGLITPLPNNYLLVENSFVQEPWNLDKTIFDLKVAGYYPILAHPERYIYYHSKRDRYMEIHGRGAMFQINLLSLAGHYGKAEQQMAEWFIEKGLVDFIGTDLHNHRHADAIEEYLKSKRYKRIAEAINVRNDMAFPRHKS